MGQWAKQKGFTIVELLIVVVVIGILAAITIGVYNNIKQRSQINRVNAELSSLKKAMLSYKVTTGELPPAGDAWNYDTDPPSCAAINNLETALQTAGIANSISKRDPWGNCWGYDDNDCNTASAVGSSTNIESVGPDGVNGGTDDISLNINIKGAC